MPIFTGILTIKHHFTSRICISDNVYTSYTIQTNRKPILNLATHACFPEWWRFLHHCLMHQNQTALYKGRRFRAKFHLPLTIIYILLLKSALEVSLCKPSSFVWTLDIIKIKPPLSLSTFSGVMRTMNLCWVDAMTDVEIPSSPIKKEE